MKNTEVIEALKNDVLTIRGIHMKIHAHHYFDGLFTDEEFNKIEAACAEGIKRIQKEIAVLTPKLKKPEIVPYTDLSAKEKKKRDELGKALWEEPKPVPAKKSVYLKGTREAFTALISQRGVYKLLGVAPSTVAGWKIYLREGKSLSQDKMEEMLLKAGSKVAVEKTWNLK